MKLKVSGGPTGFTVWSIGDRAPAIHVIVGPMLEAAEPDETGFLPTPYELGGPRELVALLERVGFDSPKEFRFTSHWKASTEEEYLNMILEGTPLGRSLSEEDPEIQRWCWKTQGRILPTT